MSIDERPHPNAICPFCEKAGMMGHQREFVGGEGVTVYKCHHCNRTWQVPDNRQDATTIRNKR